MSVRLQTGNAAGPQYPCFITFPGGLSFDFASTFFQQQFLRHVFASVRRQHSKYYMCSADEVLMDLALYSPEALLKISPTDRANQWRIKAGWYLRFAWFV